jgi:signal peptidase II
VRSDASRTAEFAAIYSVLAMTVGCDQLSKVAARTFLSPAHPIDLLGGVLKLTLSQNAGAFLGVGSRLSPTLRFLLFTVGGAVIILVGLCYLFFNKQLSNAAVVALSFVLGGAIGNQMDRLFLHGSVTDFLFVSLGPLHTGIFNVADMAILFGALYFLIDSRRRPDKQGSLDPDTSALSG